MRKISILRPQKMAKKLQKPTFPYWSVHPLFRVAGHFGRSALTSYRDMGVNGDPAPPGGDRSASEALPSPTPGGYALTRLDERPEAVVTVWGFFAVVVACAVGAWLYLRKRVEVMSVDESRRTAMERARVDAANASVERQRTAAQIAAEGEAKAQAEKVAAAGVANSAAHLSGDLQAQADAVASIVGASPSRRNETAPTFPPPGPPK